MLIKPELRTALGEANARELTNLALTAHRQILELRSAVPTIETLERRCAAIGRQAQRLETKVLKFADELSAEKEQTIRLTKDLEKKTADANDSQDRLQWANTRAEKWEKDFTAKEKESRELELNVAGLKSQLAAEEKAT